MAVTLVLELDEKGAVRDVKKFGRGFGNAIEKASRQTRLLNKAMTGLKVGLAAGAAGAVALTAAAAATAFKIKEITVASANFEEKIGDLSIASGLQVAEFSKLREAAARFGTTGDQLALGFKALSTQMLQAQQGLLESTRNFEQLGISVTDSDGKLRDMNDVFLEVADKLSQMEAGAEKTGLAVKLLGRSGQALLPFLDAGAAGIEEFSSRAERLGFVSTDASVKIATQLSHNIRIFDQLIDGVTRRLGRAFVPSLNALQEAAIEAGDSMISGIDWEAVQRGADEVVKSLITLTRAFFPLIRASILFGLTIVREFATAFKTVSNQLAIFREETILGIEILAALARAAGDEGTAKQFDRLAEAASLFGSDLAGVTKAMAAAEKALKDLQIGTDVAMRSMEKSISNVEKRLAGSQQGSIESGAKRATVEINKFGETAIPVFRGVSDSVKDVGFQLLRSEKRAKVWDDALKTIEDTSVSNEQALADLRTKGVDLLHRSWTGANENIKKSQRAVTNTVQETTDAINALTGAQEARASQFLSRQQQPTGGTVQVPEELQAFSREVLGGGIGAGLASGMLITGQAPAALGQLFTRFVEGRNRARQFREEVDRSTEATLRLAEATGRVDANFLRGLNQQRAQVGITNFLSSSGFSNNSSGRFNFRRASLDGGVRLD